MIFYLNYNSSLKSQQTKFTYHQQKEFLYLDYHLFNQILAGLGIFYLTSDVFVPTFCIVNINGIIYKNQSTLFISKFPASEWKKEIKKFWNQFLLLKEAIEKTNTGYVPDHGEQDCTQQDFCTYQPNSLATFPPLNGKIK
jgi:hypothetical protein